MNLAERRQQFEAACKEDKLLAGNGRLHKLFGVSNSAKVIGRGLQLGVVNLDNVTGQSEARAFACTIVFPPADEVYFTVYVRSGMPAMLSRLQAMKQHGAEQDSGRKKQLLELTAAADDVPPGDQDEDHEAGEREDGLSYAKRNNNTVVVLSADGNLYLRNQDFWAEMPEDRSGFGPPIPVDKINVAIYPPEISARRSLLARDFIGYLGNIVGREKVHELHVWTGSATVDPKMQRMPDTISVVEIEESVRRAGGHYPGGEVSRYHAALNYLQHKHFVILSGLSGTGKTQLAMKYARAVHGLADPAAPDPFLVICPVRSEWTDPTGLTGYYDVLSNRYTVPPFLEAMLLATAHRTSPVFVVLDEMNLARVEYYFSDLLSAMETGEPVTLHASGVPLEGSNGIGIPSALPMPPNLFITGTVNIDETTNPISDKVLDRAIVIEMADVELSGFLAGLEARNPALTASRAACEPYLVGALREMTPHGLGFGYRIAEEVVRYHHFATARAGAPSAAVIDELMVQKVLVKLRGGDRQRVLLTGLQKVLQSPRSTAFLQKLLADLDEYGSFQASR